MSHFIYGTGEGRSIFTSNDVILRALQHVSLKALANGTSHFIRIVGYVGEDPQVNNLFVSPGVPLQFIYDGTEMPDLSTDLADEFQKHLDESGGIYIPDLSDTAVNPDAG